MVINFDGPIAKTIAAYTIDPLIKPVQVELNFEPDIILLFDDYIRYGTWLGVDIKELEQGESMIYGPMTIKLDKDSVFIEYSEDIVKRYAFVAVKFTEGIVISKDLGE